jgi:hypothetical protein
MRHAFKADSLTFVIVHINEQHRMEISTPHFLEYDRRESLREYLGKSTSELGTPAIFPPLEQSEILTLLGHIMGSGVL